jgi:hypothetical protein
MQEIKEFFIKSDITIQRAYLIKLVASGGFYLTDKSELVLSYNQEVEHNRSHFDTRGHLAKIKKQQCK